MSAWGAIVRLLLSTLFLKLEQIDSDSERQSNDIDNHDIWSIGAFKHLGQYSERIIFKA